MQVVQEEIKVEYQEHMGSDLVVVNAARASFGKESKWVDDPAVDGFTSTDGNILSASDAGLIRYLASGYRSGEWQELLRQIVTCSTEEEAESIIKAARKRGTHWAPFAHPKVRIRMTIPIFLARQLAKHQVGGDWSEESRRYITSTPTFWFPKDWHTRPDDVKQGSGEALEGYIANLVNGDSYSATAHALGTYQRMLDSGVAPEEARTVLPLNTMTTAVWTGSLLFWSRVCNLRLDGHAQLAAQEFASHIQSIMAPIFPVSWKHLVG